jgi:mannosyl-oligosaccharide glucosidase
VSKWSGLLCRCIGLALHRAQCQDVYRRLRENVLSNVVQQYHASGNQFIWENYRDDDGRGQGTHPFGWSALTALMALEEF